MAEPTSGRHRDPREEPDALAGPSGSVRGALGNRRSYRDQPKVTLTAEYAGRNLTWHGAIVRAEAQIDTAAQA